MKGRTAGYHGSLLTALGIALLVCIGVAALVIALLVRRGADLRAPRVLPGEYTIARFTDEYAGGSWGIASTARPLDRPVLINADGSEDLSWWAVTRLAIAGDVLIGTGWEDESGRKVPIAFEFDTRQQRVVKLGGAADAERRVVELRFGQPVGTDAGWVDIYALPRAPRPK